MSVPAAAETINDAPMGTPSSTLPPAPTKPLEIGTYALRGQNREPPSWLLCVAVLSPYEARRARGRVRLTLRGSRQHCLWLAAVRSSVADIDPSGYRFACGTQLSTVTRPLAGSTSTRSPLRM